MTKKKEWKLGWKICAKEFSKLYPCNMLTSYPEYKMGKITKPKKGNGPLAVFKSRKDAREFKCDTLGWKIFRCKYVPSKRRNLMIRGKIATHLDCLPYGTVLAEEVMLLEKQ